MFCFLLSSMVYLLSEQHSCWTVSLQADLNLVFKIQLRREFDPNPKLFNLTWTWTLKFVFDVWPDYDLNLKLQKKVWSGSSKLNFLHTFYTKTFRLREPDLTWLFTKLSASGHNRVKPEIKSLGSDSRLKFQVQSELFRALTDFSVPTLLNRKSMKTIALNDCGT